MIKRATQTQLNTQNSKNFKISKRKTNCILTQIWSSFLSRYQNSWGKIGTSRIQCGLLVEYLSTSCTYKPDCGLRDILSSQNSFVHTPYKSGLSETTVYEVHIFVKAVREWLELKQVSIVCGPEVSEKTLRTVRTLTSSRISWQNGSSRQGSSP